MGATIDLAIPQEKGGRYGSDGSARGQGGGSDMGRGGTQVGSGVGRV